MEAKSHADIPCKLLFWTEGSRLDSGHTVASVQWRDPEWKMEKIHLGTNKEIFDAKLYAVGEAGVIALKNG